MQIKFVVAIILTLSSLTEAVAGPLEDGVAAAERGDYAAALRLWRPAAEGGSALAQFFVGRLYAEGRGVRQDFVEARRWYQQAADQGLPSAQYALRTIYYNGSGTLPNVEMAVRWFLRAANQNLPEAQFSLGYLYANGEGLQKNDIMAYMWFDLAASRFERREQREMAFREQSKVAARMMPAQIAYVRRLSRAWKPVEASRAALSTYEIQLALIWTGHLDLVADGVLGPTTRRAIVAWQKSRGYRATGDLDNAQMDDLVAEARAVKVRDFEWSVYRHPRLGYSIGFPRVAFSTVSEKPDGSVAFTTSNSGFSLITFVTSALADEQYESLFAWYSDRMWHERVGKVTFSAKQPDFFVVTGSTAASIFYLRFERRSNAAVGFFFTIPIGSDPKWRRSIVVMSNSFYVPELPPAAVPPNERVTPSPPQTVTEEKPSNTEVQLRTGTGQTELTADNLFEQVSPSVYLVIAGSTQGAERKVVQGSAVAVTSIYLLTNCHVVADQQVIILVKQDKPIQAALHFRDTSTDRCILKSSMRLPAFVPIRQFQSIRTGEAVYAIGAPKGFIVGPELTITQGIVSQKRLSSKIRYIQTSAAISEGSSGGGLFDRFGSLVGVTTFTLKESQNINFAIAAEDFLR